MLCSMTGCLRHVADDEPHGGVSTGLPKGAKKKAGKTNPYANLGLDKFSTVLSKLESQREKIMKQVGYEGTVMVGFKRSNSKQWVPIIVRLPDKKEDDDAKAYLAKRSKKAPPATPPVQPSTDAEESATQETAKEMVVREKVIKKSSIIPWGRMRPTCYWPIVVMLVLLCLVMFGRAFAIWCATIWWYLVPNLCDEGQGISKAVVGKNDHGKKANDKRMGKKVIVHLPSQVNMSSHEK